MDKIAILIPCYNEEKTVKKVIEDFHREIPESTIYVYDNNSTDNTAKIAEEAGAIVRYEKKQGKGNVVQTMFKEVDAECYIITDGDDTYAAESARDMCKEVINNGADMVIGDRLSSTYFSENKRILHGLGNIVVKKMINSLFHSNISDVMTGYRAFSYRFVKTFPANSRGFEIETEMTIHTLDKGMKITNVIVDYRDRPSGSESKISTLKDGTKITNTVFRLYRKFKPFNFYLNISMIVMIIGIIMAIYNLKESLDNGYLSNAMAVILPSSVIGLSLVILLFGTILQLKNDDNKRKFLKVLSLYSNIQNKER